MTARGSPPSPSISQLTSPPDPIPSFTGDRAASAALQNCQNSALSGGHGLVTFRCRGTRPLSESMT
jgi:hypothetical protein